AGGGRPPPPRAPGGTCRRGPPTDDPPVRGAGALGPVRARLRLAGTEPRLRLPDPAAEHDDRRERGRDLPRRDEFVASPSSSRLSLRPTRPRRRRHVEDFAAGW